VTFTELCKVSVWFQEMAMYGISIQIFKSVASHVLSRSSSLQRVVTLQEIFVSSVCCQRSTSTSRMASHRDQLLFEIYTSHLPTMVSRKCAYPKIQQSCIAEGNWQAAEEVLSKDMSPISKYLQNLEVKAHHYKNDVGSIPYPQQRS